MDGWFTSWLAWRSHPAPWLLLSFALFVVRARFHARGPGDRFAQRAEWVHLLGLPYLALLAGAASPTGMGLAGVDWVLSLGLGIPIAVAAVLLIYVARRQASRLSSMQETRHQLASDGPAGIVDAAALQLHWAFVRDAMKLWLGPYWGVWASLPVNGLLAAIRPGRERRVRPLSRLEPWLTDLVALTVTTALFAIVPNWWLTWVAHAALMVTMSKTR
ncbi:MAG: hypothetical protein Kow0047_19590 [Anaerolineae bacterium]